MTVVPVDYDSVDSLTAALQGQDAVVSTLGAPALAKQLVLVEAAVAAGVKRLVPSEFGSNSMNEKTSQLPIFADKVAVQSRLREKAQAGTLTYTLICTGPFLDWGIRVGFIMDLAGRRITLYDGGDRTVSATRTSTIGKAVAGVLAHPEETKNRAVYVQDTTITSKKLSAMGKAATAAAGSWTENNSTTEEQLTSAWAELKKDEPQPGVFVYNFLNATIWGEGYGSHFMDLDNELLGIKEMSDAELEDMVKAYAKKALA